MMRAVMVALLTGLVESAVSFVQLRYAGAPGPDKRVTAWKFVKDRVAIFEGMLGKVGVEMDDSVILGMIDATVRAKKITGEFESSTDNEGPRHYEQPGPGAAFQYLDPATGAVTWVKVNRDTGLIEPVKTHRDRATGKLVPVDEEDEETTGEPVSVPIGAAPAVPPAVPVARTSRRPAAHKK